MDKPEVIDSGRIVSASRFCQKCGKQQRVRLVRDIISSGTSQIYWSCTAHNGAINSPRINIAHEKVKSMGIIIDKLPVINNNSEYYICVVCGKVGAENHHWAPRYLFGDECDHWPQSYLCNTCHMHWHDLVTPNMRRKDV